MKQKHKIGSTIRDSDLGKGIIEGFDPATGFYSISFNGYLVLLHSSDITDCTPPLNRRVFSLFLWVLFWFFCYALFRYLDLDVLFTILSSGDRIHDLL